MNFLVCEMYLTMSDEISKAARRVISDQVLLSKLDEFTDEDIAAALQL